MSCPSTPPTFRLLDARVGWDPAHVEDLVGVGAASGVRLAPVGPSGGGIDPGAVWPHLPPPRLAYHCASCTWYLATPAPPEPRVLVLAPCDDAWRALRLDRLRLPGEIASLAVHDQLLAAADRGGDTVWVFRRDGRLVAVFAVPEPTAVAFASSCELLVAAEGGRRLLRFDPAGCPLGALALDGAGTVVRVGVDAAGTVWLVSRLPLGGFELRRLPCDGGSEPATVDELAAAFPPTGLTGIDAGGFCLARPHREEPACFTWFGRPRPVSPVAAAPPAAHFATRGQLLTLPIDSGIPRCRWHRARLDADVPEGTSVALAVATSETPDPPPQGQADPAWPGFETGAPHPADWQEVPGALDLLVDQPPGRYLFVRLRLVGDGASTPAVRQVRLDFPRATSLDLLPAVYREEPRSEDFSERFLALFDAAIEELDRAIERFPALLDAQGVPEEVLPWLGGFLGAGFDPAWEPDRRRRILAALPGLYPKRGTVAGLAEAIRLVFDVDPVIEELGLARSWGAVAADGSDPSPLAARLGAVRLFGRSRARFRLDRSPLSGAPLRSYGDPDLDPLTAGAYRFRVTVPGAAVPSAEARHRLERLVASQKPAHTVASVAVGGGHLVLGGAGGVGIDTRLGFPAPPILGVDLRLGRDSILRRGRPSAPDTTCC